MENKKICNDLFIQIVQGDCFIFSVYIPMVFNTLPKDYES